jgi:uncharacterized protein (TIGR00297 family)
MSLLLAGAISLLIVGLGYRARALSAGGALAAIVVGVMVLAGTGFPGLWGLGAFFVTSSILSRKSARFEPAWFDAPGHRRSASQVAANGLIPAVGGLIALAGNPELGLAVTVSSLASAAADTWATSVGMSSPREPFSIWQRKRVPRGTSGAVSLRGTAGGIAGAITVAMAPMLAGTADPLTLIAATSGAGGMFIDSLLGAVVQGRFHCDPCDQPSERQVHRCGAPTRLIGGLRWLDNDGVNLLANALAGAIGAAWWTLG